MAFHAVGSSIHDIRGVGSICVAIAARRSIVGDTPDSLLCFIAFAGKPQTRSSVQLLLVVAVTARAHTAHHQKGSRLFHHGPLADWQTREA